MNLVKTGLAALSIATAPVSAHAQQIEKEFTPYYVEHISKDTIANPGLISYKDIHYMDGWAGISQHFSEYFVNPDILKNNGKLKPATFRKPNPAMANKEMITKAKTKFVYDEFGNVKAILNAKGQKTREIERDPKGNLWQYTDISYTKEGKKSLEQVYDDNKILTEAREYHGNGTATVTTFDASGDVQFEGLYKTRIVNGEEVLAPTKWWQE